MSETVSEFATKAHKGQKRKDGRDYITHPIVVAALAVDIFKEFYPDDDHRAQYSELLYSVGLLHDILEDTTTTHKTLTDKYGVIVADYVLELSKIKGETYFDFIMRILHGSTVALIVKLADLRHNMFDLSEGSMKDKYRFASHLITKELKTRLSSHIL